MSSLDQFDRSLDLDRETGEPYDFVTRRRRRGSRMSKLRELYPTLDMDPETGKPYEEGLIFTELEADL
jgi:chitinase